MQRPIMNLLPPNFPPSPYCLWRIFALCKISLCLCANISVKYYYFQIPYGISKGKDSTIYKMGLGLMVFRRRYLFVFALILLFFVAVSAQDSMVETEREVSDGSMDLGRRSKLRIAYFDACDKVKLDCP